jgi:hypothetical protein
MAEVSVLRPLDAAGYRPHALHTGDRAWGEANCYVDLWIEVLHSLGLDPHAMLAFIGSSGWEGDQWTFFKPPLADLEDLYGVQVEELCLWGGMAGHVETQLRLGRLVIAEVDSFYLPDTHGVNYQLAHGKTALCAQAIDRDARRLGYYHNTGYHVLGGADYDGAMREGDAPGLWPYVELVRLDALRRRPDAELRERSRALLAMHLARRPQNPVGAYRVQLVRDVEALRAQPMEAFHRWAFVTSRMLGAAAQLYARYAAWLDATALAEAVTALETVQDGCKALQFKIARALSGKKPLDADALVAPLEAAWERAMQILASRAA